MNNSKTSLFLMELIIVILFFSVSAAVCVQLFFSAHKTDQETNQSSHAITVIQNISECYYGLDADMQSILKIYDGSTEYTDGIYLTYDENWNITSIADEIRYVATLCPINKNENAMSGYLSEADINVYEFQNSSEFNIDAISESPLITTQHISKYVQFRKGAY